MSNQCRGGSYHGQGYAPSSSRFRDGSISGHTVRPDGSKQSLTEGPPPLSGSGSRRAAQGSGGSVTGNGSQQSQNPQSYQAMASGQRTSRAGQGAQFPGDHRPGQSVPPPTHRGAGETRCGTCIAQQLPTCETLPEFFLPSLGRWITSHKVNGVPVCSYCAASQYIGGSAYYLTCRRPDIMTSTNQSVGRSRLDGQPGTGEPI